jgi:hypothetical protein
MYLDDEVARLRLAIDQDDDAVGRYPDADPRGTPKFAGVTTHFTSYPTTASAFYAVQPVRVTGTLTEGGAGTETNVGNPILCLNIGSSVPPEGTKVICYGFDRWVFRYGN